MDAYVAAHQAEWRELEHLLSRGRLSATESDRLVDLYQRVGTHLSVLRSVAPDPTLVLGLSSLLDKARRRAAARRTASWGTVARFFTSHLPAALYQLRWWWIITALVCVAVAFGYGAWVVANPHVQDAVGTPEMIQDLVNHDFEDYYSHYAASHFAFRVWTNNAWIALLCIAMGVAGLPVVQILLTNMVHIGLMGAIMTIHGKAWLFWGLITPHGLLEMTAIFVAGGAGLRLFWSWVVPGSLTRTESMAREGRRTVAIGLGLIVVLGISGLVEAFVTPSPLPTWARIAIGVAVWLAFLAYALVIGRAAVQKGFDGDIDAGDRDERTIAAA